MIAGIDLGASFIKAVVLDHRHHVINQRQAPTRDDHHTSGWMKEVAKMVFGLVEDYPEIQLVGMSAPGIPSEDNSRIQFMPGRLSGLEGHDWADYLGYPVFILNDANAAMLAESRLGVAQGYDPVILLTLGTGVGGSILINGQLFTGYKQVGGHLGHLSVNMHSQVRSITGMPGSLEDAIGEASLSRRTKGSFHSTLDLINSMEQGNEEAKAVWNESVKALAIGLAALGNIISPQLVILGGGIVAAGDILLDPLKAYLDEYEWRPGGKQFELKIATAGSYAGAIGAGIFASEKNKL